MLWQKRNYYTNIMSVTNMMRILIYCILLLALVACNNKGVQDNKQFFNTRPAPGFITCPYRLGKKETQKCVPKDTFSVLDDATCK